jgi:hypothetical protein
LSEFRVLEHVYYFASCNIPLTDEKINLIKKLKCDVLELMTDSPYDYDVNGFMRAMYIYILFACDKNTKTGSEGDVNILLTTQINRIEQYYAEDAMLAKTFYEANTDFINEDQPKL